MRRGMKAGSNSGSCSGADGERVRRRPIEQAEKQKPIQAQRERQFQALRRHTQILGGLKASRQGEGRGVIIV